MIGSKNPITSLSAPKPTNDHEEEEVDDYSYDDDEEEIQTTDNKVRSPSLSPATSY